MAICWWVFNYWILISHLSPNVDTPLYTHVSFTAVYRWMQHWVAQKLMDRNRELETAIEQVSETIVDLVKSYTLNSLGYVGQELTLAEAGAGRRGTQGIFPSPTPPPHLPVVWKPTLPLCRYRAIVLTQNDKMPITKSNIWEWDHDVCKLYAHQRTQ